MRDVLETIRETLAGVGAIKPVQSLVSAVTIDWKVRWTPDMISRDLMQNFRDAAKGRLRQVRVKALPGKRVFIAGPEEFNVARLFYIGSEKSAEAGDLGGFGEGFKAASVALLRDYATTPVVVSGREGVILTVADKPIAGTDMRPLEYHFFEHDGDLRGTRLLLLGANRELVEAVGKGRDWFFDSGHPAIAGDCLYANEDVALYASKRQDGLAFYCGHLRMKLDGLPVVIDYKWPEDKLESMVSTDRDRRMFEEKSQDRFLYLIAKDLDKDGRRALIRATRTVWQAGRGHVLLRSVALRTRASEAATIDAMRQEIDPEGTLFFVERGEDDDLFRYRGGQYAEKGKPASQQEIDAQCEKWRSEGRIELPRYFARLGVRTAREEARLERERQCIEQQVRDQERLDKESKEALARRREIERQHAQEARAMEEERRRRAEEVVRIKAGANSTLMQREKASCLEDLANLLMPLAAKNTYVGERPSILVIRITTEELDVTERAWIDAARDCGTIYLSERYVSQKFGLVILDFANILLNLGDKILPVEPFLSGAYVARVLADNLKAMYELEQRWDGAGAQPGVTARRDERHPDREYAPAQPLVPSGNSPNGVAAAVAPGHSVWGLESRGDADNVAPE